MRISSFGFVGLWILFFVHCSAFAEILAPDDLDSLAEPETEQLEKISSTERWLPEVSVHVGAGRAKLPYGPPGMDAYKTPTRFTAFALGATRVSNSGSWFEALSFDLGLKNNFPSAARQYEVQAVSWLDLSAKAQAEGHVSLFDGSILRWLLGAESNYERFHYPRGTMAIHGFPLGGGLSFLHETSLFEQSLSFAVDTQIAILALGQTAVKYNAAGTSPSREVSRVSIEPLKKVSGSELQASFDVGFSSFKARSSIQKTHHKHQFSFVWQTKTRQSDGFVVERNELKNVEATSPLDFSQTNWGVRWTERL
jgi:hypothetical protein